MDRCVPEPSSDGGDLIRGLLPDTNAGTGGPGGHFIFEDLDNPYGPTSLVEIVLPPHINAALAAFGAPPHFANYASLGIPPAIGSFAYNPASDAVGLTWPATDPRLESSWRRRSGPSRFSMSARVR